MSKRGAIRSVLHDLLGTFTSRYSDYEGFWLLGFLVGDLDRRSIDLLGGDSSVVTQSPWGVASTLARAKFRELTATRGVRPASVRSADLEIARLPGTTTRLVNSQTWEGFSVKFVARATMDDGRSYERERRVFVAPHSDREMRSGRWNNAMPPQR